MTIVCLPLLLTLLTNFLIQPTTWALSPNLQTHELDDNTILQHEFPSIIEKLKLIVNQFYCSKDWKKYGGSCYYLSKTASRPTRANDVCNLLHSNQPNLMRIRNTAELSYAAHLLTKNNLSALMIEIDPVRLKEKNMAERFEDDKDQWQRMKNESRELRVKYNKLKEKIMEKLNTADLHISRRKKKIKAIVKQRQNDSNTYRRTMETDKYEYKNLYLDNDSDELKEMDESRSLCDQIKWNVVNNNSLVYQLRVSMISNKMVCSLSDVESDIQYRHVCQYVLDVCLANTACGKHGRCVNTLTGFKCSCSILYGGPYCEEISNRGIQIMIALILILVLYVLSLKPTQWALLLIVKRCIRVYRLMKRNKKNHVKHRTGKFKSRHTVDENQEEAQELDDTNPVRPTVVLPKRRLSSSEAVKPNKLPHVRSILTGSLSIIFLILLLSLTTITMYSTSIQSDMANDTVQLITKCQSLAINPYKNIVFSPIAFVLILIFSLMIKREKHCLDMCHGRPGFISPIEPFRLRNRFQTGAVFGIVAFEILKTFEEFVLNTDNLLNLGILTNIFQIIGVVFVTGLSYYPILASFQIRNFFTQLCICLYLLAMIIYTILHEGLCISPLSTSESYSVLKPAKLLTKRDLWLFIIQSLIKNIPHFILLSYLAAELLVRFAYDSIYVPLTKKQSIWALSITQFDESAFVKSYVTKLFRKTDSKLQRKPTDATSELPLVTNVICIYTVAIVVLYYLAYTFVVVCVVRPTDYIILARQYIETTFNIEFQGFFSLPNIFILSAVITILIIAYQMFIGLINYNKHKQDLFKGVYDDIPSSCNFQSNEIVLNSIRYFGFLIGHMTCGFIIIFHLIIFILCAVRIISLYRPYTEFFVTIIVPVLIMYLTAMVSISFVGNFLFTHNTDQNPYLQNRKIYPIFLYLNFCFDCFLSLPLCIIGIIRATFFNVLYIPRLDSSMLRRPLERLDRGFAAYVSYLHIEVAHTHPIVLAFCYSLYDDVVQRRAKYNSDRIEADQNSGLVSIAVSSSAQHLLDKSRKNKSARFRWYCAYTMLNNFRLFDHRKRIESRLTLLKMRRNSLIHECQPTSSEWSTEQPRTTTWPLEISISPTQQSTIVVSPRSRCDFGIYQHPRSASEQYTTPRSVFFRGDDAGQVDRSLSANDSLPRSSNSSESESERTSKQAEV